MCPSLEGTVAAPRPPPDPPANPTPPGARRTRFGGVLVLQSDVKHLGQPAEAGPGRRPVGMQRRALLALPRQRLQARPERAEGPDVGVQHLPALHVHVHQPAEAAAASSKCGRGMCVCVTRVCAGLRALGVSETSGRSKPRHQSHTAPGACCSQQSRQGAQPAAASTRCCRSRTGRAAGGPWPPHTPRQTCAGRRHRQRRGTPARYGSGTVQYGGGVSGKEKQRARHNCCVYHGLPHPATPSYPTPHTPPTHTP